MLLPSLPYLTEKRIRDFIETALREDLGEGDFSTLSVAPHKRICRARLLVKDSGVLAGVALAERIFHFLDSTLDCKFLIPDGACVNPGDVAFEVTGNFQTILSAERLVLNCMQRMSGIATLTRQYTEKLKGYKTRLLDTRKTTPNFRLLEKEAVRIGGGVNHRFGLYDMIMLKDNHIDFCGGIEKAIEKAWNYVQDKKPGLKIEVETRSLDDVKRVLATGKVDRIMLDNFTPELIKEALVLIDGKYETEASGGINLGNLEAYAATGVDFISSGAIIHQARSLDLSLKAVTVGR